MKGNCQPRETVSSTPHLCPPALPAESSESGPQGCSALSQGGAPSLRSLSGYLAHLHTLISSLLKGEAGGSLPGELHSEPVCLYPLAFYLHTQNLTFLLPTNPQHHLLHFCMILSPPGPRRGQGRAKQGLFLEDLLSFFIYHLLSVPQQKTFPIDCGVWFSGLYQAVLALTFAFIYLCCSWHFQNGMNPT